MSTFRGAYSTKPDTYTTKEALGILIQRAVVRENKLVIQHSTVHIGLKLLFIRMRKKHKHSIENVHGLQPRRVSKSRINQINKQVLGATVVQP